MRSRIVRIVLPALAAGVLQAQIQAPKIGTIRCSDGSVHAVYGLAANFIVANQSIASADAVSFSDKAGLIAKNGKIQLFGSGGVRLGEYRSHETSLILNIDDDATSALAWLPSAHAILRWDGTQFRVFPMPAIEGRVTFIAAGAGDRAQLLILNNDGSTSHAVVTLSTGDLVNSDIVPGVNGSVFAQQGSLIFREGQHLAVETRDGVQHALPVPGNVVIERMSSEWLHLSSAGKGHQWALHLASQQPELFVLPDARSNGEVAK
jgi:hypothetical protein